MNTQVRHDLRISGSASTSGGTFRDVRIIGEGRIDGDLDCIGLTCQGQCDIGGSMKAESIRVLGHAVVEGNVTARRAKLNGHLEVAGRADVNEFRIDGMAGIRDGLSADTVELKGILRSDGDVEAERFKAKGAFEIGGLLNAGRVDVVLHDSCATKEIGGGTITVRRSAARRLLGNWFGSAPCAELTVELIEGDDIELEYVRAKEVRGDRVAIGAGCEIGRVEYRSHLHRDRRAKVDDVRQA